MIDDGAVRDSQMATCCTQQLASIVIGSLHSLPLNLKNHRLHLLEEPYTLAFPWNETLIAESDCNLLDEQSWKETKGKKSVLYYLDEIVYTIIKCFRHGERQRLMN